MPGSAVEPRTRPLAASLNEACQCVWVDRAKLHDQLRASLGDTGDLLESRAGLVSGSVVFIGAAQAAAMDRTIRLITRALASPAYRARAQRQAPALPHPSRLSAGGVLGFDFHLGDPEPQLIEINTNPGGLLVNLELARAATACCDCLGDPVATMASADVDIGRLGQRIADAAGLTTSADTLLSGSERIDLVYNRLTDFYLVDERHAALRRAYEAGLAVVTPHPAAHAQWADKRLLAWLREEQWLRDAGLGADDAGHLRRTIPATEIVDPAAADDLWQRRRQLFFKPVDGFAGKAAYRGDKLTRSTFAQVLSHRYVAQALAPTSFRRVASADGGPADLRVDVRNYSLDGETWLRAARLYRGQTTNFRTAGGGFAPVLTLPA